ncbi:MAG: serine/threonine protein kinase [Deltaproteobacteria bacterium]|nr:serine/threonine protein kinase [Deltaproteobacteria bacterium]
MATCPKCRKHYDDDVHRCPDDGESLLSDEAFAGVDPDLEPGQKVGEYEVERKIGAGGFGTVYLAVHPLIGKTVAIKLLNREYSTNPQMVSRFIEEARAVNQIRHRNIIDIFSFGALEDKRQYFVMEYLDGKPLDAYLKERGRLSIEDSIPILRQIARALDAAHVAGIAHRDLKPENIFLTFDEDGHPFPKLLDFGIAKLFGEAHQSGHKTATGQPIGTPYYMSPEQCLGTGVDHRTDVYSFGIVAHELLTGKLPFHAEQMMKVMVMQMSHAPPSMSSVVPSLPPELDPPVLQMLAKEADQRPESVQAGLEALAQAAKDLGKEVEVASIKRGGVSTPGLLSSPTAAASGKLTPEEEDLMGGAQTVEAPLPTPLRSTTPSTATVPAATGGELLQAEGKGGARNKTVIGVAVAGLAIGALVVVLAVKGGEESTPQPAPSVAAAPTTTAAPATTSEPAAPPATTSDPAAPKLVKLTVQSTPKTVDVYRDDEKLGTAPGPIVIERSDEPVKLTFKAPGHRTETRDVTPTADGFVSIDLPRLPRKPVGAPATTGKGKTGKDDLVF